MPTDDPDKGLHFSIKLTYPAAMPKSQSSIQRFGLYGEGQSAIEPEFVHIETILARSSLHGGVIGAHLHQAIFQVLYLVSGHGWFATDGREEALKAPGLVVVPCGCTHYFRFKPDAQGWVLSIADSLLNDPRLASLGVEWIARGTDALALGLGAAAQTSLLSVLLADLARRHIENPGQLTSSSIALIGVILSTVEELTSEMLARSSGGRDRRIELVRRFTRLVEGHYREHWSVQRFATNLGTTTQTLTRACRSVTGRAPGRIALDRVLREAMRSLSYTTASIAEISDDLGFSDPAYFARIFRKHCGVTASEFRRGKVQISSFSESGTVNPDQS